MPRPERRCRLGSLAFIGSLGLSILGCSAADDDSKSAVPGFVGLAPSSAPAPATSAVTPSASVPSAADAPSPSAPTEPTEEAPSELPLDMSVPPATAPADGGAPAPAASTNTPASTAPPATPPEAPVMPSSIEPTPARAAGGTRNLFSELLGIPEADVVDKVQLAANRIFGIGTNESTTPTANAGYRLYYELPQNREQAFIWAADSNDIRSEGMSYGMMIAVQMDMQREFDRLWNFARTYMQFAANDNLTAWRHYFRWQGSVNTANANAWQVNYDAQTGPAPDGDEYITAALYLADRRWGSDGAINYRQEADSIATALLDNPSADGRTPLIDRNANMVVFFPQGDAASFSDPSYHLPAFYELFAQDGPASTSERWRRLAATSRQYWVTSANGATGLHPDYANFNGSPNAGGDNHDQFRFDAWRVIMNMAVDYTWGSQDQRLKTQIEKYHAFFTNQLDRGNVRNSLFALNGSNASGGGSTALTATLASGSLVSNAANRATFVQNLWNIPQQTGTFRYYQETVYMLGLLSVAGRFSYAFGDR